MLSVSWGDRKRESWSFRFRRRMGMRILKPRWRRCMIRRVRICIWRGGFFFFLLDLLGLLRFCGHLCALFFALFSLDRFLWAVFFGPFSLLFSSSCFSSCFFLSLGHFLRPARRFFVPFFPPSLSLPSRRSRLANVILLFDHFFFFGFLGFLWADLFVLLSFHCFISAIFFSPFSLCRFLRPRFFVPFALSRFIVRFIRLVFFPSLSLPSRIFRLANVILRFRLPLSIDEPVCLPP